MTTPLVTVVVPTYNSQATLQYALESIGRQHWTDFEVWVVGDACTDGSGDVVGAMEDPRFHWYNRSTNSGSGGAPCNDGLHRARGQYIAYLGHDDLWFPWHLSSLVEVARGRAPFVHSLCALLGPREHLEMCGPPADADSYRGHFVPPSCWLHERELAERVGGWRNPDVLTRGVDFDLLQRIAASGARITCSPRLSVVKWPSAWWRAYAEDARRPQIAVAAELARDPHALAERILNDCALAFAHRTWRGRALTVRGELREAARHAWTAARVAGRNTVEPAGRSRGPLERLLRWRYQAIRRRLRADRGLERTADASPPSDTR